MKKSFSAGPPMGSTPFYDTQSYDIIGIETVVAVHAISTFRALGAGIGAIFGGRSELLEKTFMDAREQALLELQEKARRDKADLVVGIEVEVQEQSRFIIFTVTGTLLKKKMKRKKK
jgi:uncharacterized protein YbjQ (UPF0145 family)